MDDFRGETMPLPQFGQQRGVAAALGAEGEVGARYRDPRTNARVQPVTDKALRRQRRQRRVEWDHHRRIDAEAREQIELLVEPGQRERRRIGAEQRGGVRVERRDQRRAALGARARQCPADDRLVAGMETIKVTERNDTAAHGGSDTFARGIHVHRRLHSGAYAVRQAGLWAAPLTPLAFRESPSPARGEGK
jgi:hypothetical protein